MGVLGVKFKYFLLNDLQVETFQFNRFDLPCYWSIFETSLGIFLLFAYSKSEGLKARGSTYLSTSPVFGSLKPDAPLE